MKKLLLLFTVLLFQNSYGTNLNDKVDIVFNVSDSSQYKDALSASKDTLLKGYNISIVFGTQMQVNYVSHNTGYVLGTLYSMYFPEPKAILQHANNAYSVLFVFNKGIYTTPTLQKAGFQPDINKP